MACLYRAKSDDHHLLNKLGGVSLIEARAKLRALGSGHLSRVQEFTCQGQRSIEYRLLESLLKRPC